MAMDAKSLLAELQALRRSVGEGLPERTVRCRVDPADIKPRNFPDATYDGAVRSQKVWGGTAHTMSDGRTLIVPDWGYDASRDKPDAPVLDVWGELLSLEPRPKPAWPSKQRVGLYLPE